MTETEIEIPRPTSGDVLERILEDHELFEDLLRLARRTDTDREAARAALAEVLVAHAVAEEELVYPELRRARAISGHEKEHGEEEHAEINEALLAFLQAKGTDTEKYDEALEELATVVNHHANEEEQTILNPAREEVSLERREELGVAWLTRRNTLLEEGCAQRGAGRRAPRGGRGGGRPRPRGGARGGRRHQGGREGEGQGGRGGRQEGRLTPGGAARRRATPGAATVRRSGVGTVSP